MSQKFKLGIERLLFVFTHSYSLCKSFCSICVSSSSFIPIEGFEYHRLSMTVLSQLFRNLYQIYVLGIGGALTLMLGVRHFSLELHLLLIH